MKNTLCSLLFHSQRTPSSTRGNENQRKVILTAHYFHCCEQTTVEDGGRGANGWMRLARWRVAEPWSSDDGGELGARGTPCGAAARAEKGRNDDVIAIDALQPMRDATIVLGYSSRN